MAAGTVVSLGIEMVTVGGRVVAAGTVGREVAVRAGVLAQAAKNNPSRVIKNQYLRIVS